MLLVSLSWSLHNGGAHDSSIPTARCSTGRTLQTAIHPIDVGIVVVYLLGVVAFGIWIGRKDKDLSGYLLGGRDLPWWAVLGSIVATETSTATFLSVPGLAFAAGGDLRFLQLALGFLLGRILVTLFLLPQYFRGDLYTAYEVLNVRFGGATKQAASVLFLVARNLGDGLRLFLTAIVLEQVAGFDLPTCIVIIGIATIAYTFFGGMKAVVWNDCIQFVVYITGGVLAGLLIVNALPDGWRGLWSFAETRDKLRVFDFSLDFTQAFTFWAGIIGGATLTLGTHGTDQMMVQRYLCARSQRDAGRALVLSGGVVIVQFALFLLLGVALACYYTQVSPTTFERNDEVFASFIVTAMPVGLVGITLAAVFSTAMSTLSSSLNSSASSAVNDLYLPWRKIAPDSRHALVASRTMTVLFGVVQILVGIAASRISRSVVNDALAIAGFTAGILLGVFALGVLTRRVRQPGALFGLLCGLAVLTAVNFATRIAWPWFAVIGATCTFAAGYAYTLIFPRPEARGPGSTSNETLDDD